MKMDTKEVALFLACSMSQEEIDSEGLTDVVPRRRCKKGPRPRLSCKAITGGNEARGADKSWLPAKREAGIEQKRRMLGCLVKCVIKLIMKNHFNTFNNEIRKQSKGGAIGNKLTEMLGKLLMKRFDKKYLNLLKKLGIENELYERYVDDETDILVAVDPGVRFDGEKLEKIEELVNDDEAIAEDERTLNLLKEIGGSIYKCVQFTIDCPSLQPGGMVPILDLKVYIENDQIIHEYFEKPVACKVTIPHSSAHSTKMKMAVLVEEGMRRMRNHSRGLEWEKRRRVMAAYSQKLRRSGYPKTIRHQVIKTVCERWDRACQEEDQGTRPIHRPREWKERQRRLEKERKITKWHQTKPGQVSAPLILDPTAGNMAIEMREICCKFETMTGMKILVKERAGEKNKQIAMAEPLKEKTCGRENCFPCSTGGGNCEKNGIGYRVTCLTCLGAGRSSQYEGESGRNGFTRGLEHLKAVRLKDEENAIWKHCLVEHEGNKAEFEMKILRSFNSCLERQVNEAVRIIISKADLVLNSRSEFRQAPIVRIVPTTGLQGEQEGSRSTPWTREGGRGLARGNTARSSRGLRRLPG